MKKPCLAKAGSGFTLVEIMIVVGIIGLLATMAIPAFLRSRNEAAKQICIENLTKIESAKQVWGLEAGKHEGDVPMHSDLIGPDLYIKKEPDCPGGGVYDFKALGVNATCTITSHTL